MKNTLAIVRTCSEPVDINNYNIQEIGLGRALCGKGFDVDIYFFDNRRVHDETIEICRYGDRSLTIRYLHRVALPGKQAFNRDILSILMKERYDIVQVHEECMILSALIARKLSKIGSKIVLYQGMYEPYEGAKGHLQRAYNLLAEPVFRASVDCFLAKTSLAKRYLERKNLGPVHLAPIGLDLDAFDSHVHDDGAFSRFASQFDIVLSYIGKLEPRRQPEFIVSILDELATYSNAGLLIIGDGPSRKDTVGLIRRRRLEDRVLMLDQVPNREIGRYLSQCDVFLLPSKYEIYGMVVMEALLFGVPVLSSPTAGPLDIILSSSQGRIIRGSNVREWAAACLDVCNCKPSREMLRQYITDNYDWSRCAETYLAALLDARVL